jgi:ABC-type transporter Mla subunit MlaD
MDLTYKQEVTVGALVLVGFVVFTGFMFWLTGRSIVSKAIVVPVTFKNVSGLKEGDPVRVSGVKKGRVGQVRLQRVGRVTVTLDLDPEVRPHKDARATVASADFLGAKYVDYDPGASDTMLATGQTIAGLTEEQFADVAQGAAKSAQELIANVNKGLNPGQLANDIHNTLLATQRGDPADAGDAQVARGGDVAARHAARQRQRGEHGQAARHAVHESHAAHRPPGGRHRLAQGVARQDRPGRRDARQDGERYDAVQQPECDAEVADGAADGFKRETGAVPYR